MGIFSRKKAEPETQTTGLEVSRWRSAPPRRNTSALLDAYKELPRLSSCVDVISDGVAEVEWTATVNGKDDPTHPILTLLENPNDLITGRELLKLISTHLDLVGEAYIVVEESAGYPIALWPLVPDQILNLPDYSAPRDQRFYSITSINGPRMVPADKVIPLKRLDPRNPLGRGVGIAQSLSDELDTDEYASRFIKNLLYNNALPAAVIGIESPAGSTINSTANAAFTEKLKREHGGPENAGKTMITPGKVTMARLDTPLKDLGLVDLRKYIDDFIRITFKIPPELIGNLSSSNRATAFAAREHLATSAIQPRIKTIQAALQKHLAARFGAVVTLGFKKIIPSDKDRQLAVMTLVPHAFSYNEIRALADMEPDSQRQGYPMPPPGSKPEDAPIE